MQIIANINGSTLKTEGQNVVRSLQGEPRSGYLYMNTIRPNVGPEIGSGGIPMFRHLNITLAGEPDLLPPPSEIDNYTITVTIDIVPNEPPE